MSGAAAMRKGTKLAILALVLAVAIGAPQCAKTISNVIDVQVDIRAAAAADEAARQIAPTVNACAEHVEALSLALQIYGLRLEGVEAEVFGDPTPPPPAAIEVSLPRIVVAPTPDRR